MTLSFKSVKDIKSALVGVPKPVGLVPTMGALHAGHISLIEASKFDCKTTVVSIFVNPLQFAPGEDYAKYPRDIDSDLNICRSCGVQYVFAPSEDEVYPEGRKEIVIPQKNLAEDLCGRTRKGHFSGVSTVVKKLFDITSPDIAYFGEKDLQQVYVIKWLVDHFKYPILVKSCPTVREKNSLACSSRNQYFTDEQKDVASNLYKALLLAKKNVRSGFFAVSRAILESLVFLSRFPDIQAEYFEARKKEDFSKASDSILGGFYFLSAANVFGVRLIDNIEV